MHRVVFKNKEDFESLFTNPWYYTIDGGFYVSHYFDEQFKEMFPNCKINIFRKQYNGGGDDWIKRITIDFKTEEELILFMMKRPYHFVYNMKDS